jgi:hypothetical protein
MNHADKGTTYAQPRPPGGVFLWGIAEIEQIVFNPNGNAKTMDLAVAPRSLKQASPTNAS